MKKLLSLVLALVMVVGVIAPARVNAAESQNEYVFNQVKVKFGTAINTLGPEVVKTALANFVDAGFINATYSKGKSVLNQSEYLSLKTHINTKLGISEEVAGSIVLALNNAISDSINTEKLINDLATGTMSQDSSTYIGNTITSINTALGANLDGKLAVGQT